MSAAYLTPIFDQLEAKAEETANEAARRLGLSDLPAAPEYLKLVILEAMLWSGQRMQHAAFVQSRQLAIETLKEIGGTP
jgi:hypothetical protein